jgi:ParB family transcriptional regulator, chromosome partitioning protein
VQKRLTADHQPSFAGKDVKKMVVNATAAQRLEFVLVSDLKPGPNVRSHADEAELRLLGQSLKERQFHPLVVTPELEIVDGWRRWSAAKATGIERLWAVIGTHPLTDGERIAAQLAMSLHRAGLTEQEKVKACEELMAAVPGLNQKSLAQRLNVNDSTVSRWLSVSGGRVVEEVRQAFFGGHIGLKEAYEISRVESARQLEMLATAQRGGTRDQLTRSRRQLRSTNSENRPARLRCPLSDGRAVSIAGRDLTFDTVIELLTELLTSARKAQKEGLDLHTWEAVLGDKAK